MDDLDRIFRMTGLSAPHESLVDLGSASRTHVFVLGDVVVKYDDESRIGAGSMVREVQALKFLESGDLPVPRVLDAGEFPDTRRWVVLTRLPGLPPDDALGP